MFVDDFCALGETACSIIPSLQELGAKVSYAVYVSKNFQGGLERVKKLGVDSFAVVEIKSISPEGKIILVN